MCQEGVA
ncbi:hypothetical protein MACJ_003810 [Theileria orientalis]|nr:hypothetical protein MACJ_003810 [Theileria orientalis]